MELKNKLRHVYLSESLYLCSWPVEYFEKFGWNVTVTDTRRGERRTNQWKKDSCMDARKYRTKRWHCWLQKAGNWFPAEFPGTSLCGEYRSMPVRARHQFYVTPVCIKLEIERFFLMPWDLILTSKESKKTIETYCQNPSLSPFVKDTILWMPSPPYKENRFGRFVRVNALGCQYHLIKDFCQWSPHKRSPREIDDAIWIYEEMFWRPEIIAMAICFEFWKESHDNFVRQIACSRIPRLHRRPLSPGTVVCWPPYPSRVLTIDSCQNLRPGRTIIIYKIQCILMKLIFLRRAQPVLAFFLRELGEDPWGIIEEFLHSHASPVTAIALKK